jgi:hypothetical protein
MNSTEVEGIHENTVDADVSPTCSFLNLIPGVHDEGGVCSQSSPSAQNTTVCGAISASEQAVSRLHSGRSIVSVFVGPGSCAELQGGACWESEAGLAYYGWASFDSSPAGVWRMDPELRLNSTLALALMVSYSEGGKDDDQCGLTISATDFQATIGADDWTAGSEGSPRWTCFDLPPDQMGSAYSILAYSIGDLPCVAAPTTTGSSDTTTATTESSSCTRVVHGFLARAVGAALAVSLWA